MFGVLCFRQVSDERVHQADHALCWWLVVTEGECLQERAPRIRKQGAFRQKKKEGVSHFQEPSSQAAQYIEKYKYPRYLYCKDDILIISL